MQMKSTITLPPQLHQIEIELELFNKFIPLTLIISQKITPYAFIRFGETQAAYAQAKPPKKTILFQRHLALAFKVILF